VRRQLEETIRNAQEGFEESGLLSSGKRMRAEGKADIEGQEQLGSIERGTGLKVGESQKRQQRTLEDLASGQKTYQRKWEAERETALTTDVEEQRRQANEKRE